MDAHITFVPRNIFIAFHFSLGARAMLALSFKFQPMSFYTIFVRWESWRLKFACQTQTKTLLIYNYLKMDLLSFWRALKMLYWAYSWIDIVPNVQCMWLRLLIWLVTNISNWVTSIMWCEMHTPNHQFVFQYSTCSKFICISESLWQPYNWKFMVLVAA
mgnify:CR=1 FL=1